MYTVCWVDRRGRDRWERCRTRTEVEMLLMREGIQGDAEALIFTPHADEYSITGKEFC